VGGIQEVVSIFKNIH